MRDFFCFRNAREFQQLFGYRNGTRMNKILLSFLMSKRVFKYDHELMRVNSMPMLKQVCMSKIGFDKPDEFSCHLHLMGRYYYLDDYRTDRFDGICQDDDAGAVRYERDGYTFKMRAGKLFRKIILNSPFGSLLPDQVITWLCEEFAYDWNTYAQSCISQPYKLVTGFDGLTFADIYGNGKTYYQSDMHSCMTGRNRHPFYDKSVVDCYPAALIDRRNPQNLVARCVVFNKVRDIHTGEVFRLAERQYSSIGEKGMRQLINELKKAGLIDGYKFIGASCSDSTNFISVNGDYMGDRTLAIECNFKNNRTLSYQDSFKFYNNRDHLAYNRSNVQYDFDMATTTDKVPIHQDTYHDKEIFGHGVYKVWVNGKRLTCDNRDMGDFICFYGDYYHYQHDVTKCPTCGRTIGAHHFPDNLTSRLTGKSYCSERCKRLEEIAIGDSKKFFSVYDNTFVDKASMLTNAFVWYYMGSSSGYKKVSIMKDTLSVLLSVGMACKYKGKTYVGLDGNGKPIMRVTHTPKFAE